jgi:ATP-dependent DNA helicase RecQ
LPIDYVPPFRGNATRIIDRKKRPRDLEIDFPALDVRRRREYDKLERMVKYCQASECRRAVILGYFGDTSLTECGHCDNCEGQGGGSATARVPIDSEAGREVLLKVLSGVARAKGRFGKTIVAQMLVGSKVEKLIKFQLDQLSTFGILAAFRQPEVMQILDALTRAGLIEAHEVDSFRPVIALSDSGRAFLKDPSTTVALELPADLASKVKLGGLARIVPKAPARANGGESPEDGVSAESDPLWERLRKLRLVCSREEGKPAYSIFPDETLAALVRERPQSPNDLLRIKGMGPSRLEKYGQAILNAIAGAGEVVAKPPPQPEPIHAPVAARPAPPTTSTASTYVPTEEWTYRLLERGFSALEVAEIRGLSYSAIVRHATLLARQGRPVPLEAFIARETLERWNAWHSERGDVPPTDSEADEWALYLAST